MNPFKYVVSLRIEHPSWNPEIICNELGMKAERKWKVGEKRQTPKGKPLIGTYDETYCSFELKPPKKLELVEFLKLVNGRLNEHKKFFEKTRKTGGKIEYFIGWYSNEHTGQSFDLELMEQLLDLQIELGICIYCSNIKT